jgi:hypothetical protein
MKKNLFLTAASIAALILVTAMALAQQPAPQTIDQEIESLEKRLLELKQRKRDTLAKQVNALRGEVEKLEHMRSDSLTAPLEQPRTNADPNASTISPRASSVGSDAAGGRALSAGNVNVNPAVSNPPVGAQQGSGNQTANRCYLVGLDPGRYSRFDQQLCFLARNIYRDRTVENASNKGIDLTGHWTNLLPVLYGQMALKSNGVIRNIGDERDEAGNELARLILDVEASRNDKQLGADDRSSGTTSVGVRGGIPAILSWAVENGAATASSSGSTLTFRVNPVGLIEALSGQGYVSSIENSENDRFTNFLRRGAVGLSFDISRGADPPTFIGSKQQLSAISYRYELVNQRDPRRRRYQGLWKDFLERRGDQLASIQNKQLGRLAVPRTRENNFAAEFKNRALQQWLNRTNEALNETTVAPTALNEFAAIEEIQMILAKRLSELPISELERDPEFIDAINSFVGAYIPYLEGRKEILDEVAKGALVTFEYTNYREVNAPDVSNFRFIAEKASYGKVNLTANASLSIYNKLPKMMTPAGMTQGAEVKRIRDFSFTGQIDVPLRDVMGLGDSNLSFAGKYQRLTSDAVALDGAVLPNTKGDVAVGQVKLVIPIKDTGFKLPISITFANRTELVREKEVRGNFGVTFDLDTLFARFKPFK